MSHHPSCRPSRGFSHCLHQTFPQLLSLCSHQLVEHAVLLFSQVLYHPLVMFGLLLFLNGHDSHSGFRGREPCACFLYHVLPLVVPHLLIWGQGYKSGIHNSQERQLQQ